MKRWIWDRAVRDFVPVEVTSPEEFRKALLRDGPACSKCGVTTYDGLCGKCAYEIAGPKGAQ